MVLALGCGAARADTYRFISFDYPGAAGATMASGINYAGQVVGASADGTGEHGFLMDVPSEGPRSGQGMGKCDCVVCSRKRTAQPASRNQRPVRVVPGQEDS